MNYEKIASNILGMFDLVRANCISVNEFINSIPNSIVYDFGINLNRYSKTDTHFMAFYFKNQKRKGSFFKINMSKYLQNEIQKNVWP